MLAQGLGQRRSVAVDMPVQQSFEFAVTADQAIDSLG